MSSYGDRPRRAAARRRRTGPSRAVTAVLVVVGMVVLFAAGFGISTMLRGDSGGSASPTDGGGDGPTPCETVTVAPADVLPKPAQVTVNVYNSTTREGLAAATADVLKERDFTIGVIANDPVGKTIAGVAQIRYGAKGLQAAELMAYYLPGSTLVDDKRKTADIDVALGVSYQSVAPQADVDKALSTPTAIPTGPGCTSAPAPESSSESAPAESSPAA